MFLISTVFFLCTLLGLCGVHLLCVVSLKDGNPGTSEMAQRIKELAAKYHNLSLIPGTDGWKLFSDLHIQLYHGPTKN